MHPLFNSERYPYGDVRSLSSWTRYVRPKRWQLSAMDGALELIAAGRRAAIIHVHHGYALERVARAARRRHLPVVLSLHGHDVTGYLEQRPDAYRSCHDVVSAVVVPSAFLVEYAEQAGFVRDLIRVQPSGIDLSSFASSPIPDGPPTALFVGRFVPKKGVDVLARAWPAVQASVPDARLVLCGFGQQEELARSIAGNVTVIIAPDRATVRAQMRSCRFVVSPSHIAPDDAIESLLVVNVEAQASGRPVVTTRHGAIPEFVAEGRSAILVPEGDAVALAEAMVSLLENKDLARRMGAHGPPTVAHLDVRATAARIDALYNDVLAGELLGPSPTRV
jgi:colanic acid/amylovoran biosynthesis glycosyltransferase